MLFFLAQSTLSNEIASARCLFRRDRLHAATKALFVMIITKLTHRRAALVAPSGCSGASVDARIAGSRSATSS
jgi:hypothetical protein